MPHSAVFYLCVHCFQLLIIHLRVSVQNLECPHLHIEVVSECKIMIRLFCESYVSLSVDMRFTTMWYVQPAYAQSDQSLC